MESGEGGKSPGMESGNLEMDSEAMFILLKVQDFWC